MYCTVIMIFFCWMFDCGKLESLCWCFKEIPHQNNMKGGLWVGSSAQHTALAFCEPWFSTNKMNLGHSSHLWDITDLLLVSCNFLKWNPCSFISRPGVLVAGGAWYLAPCAAPRSYLCLPLYQLYHGALYQRRLNNLFNLALLPPNRRPAPPSS